MHIVGRDDADDGRVQSVERATDLLQAVADAAGARATVTELAAATGLNRATAWRILRTLEAKGFVHRDPRTRSFTIGTTVVDLARAAPDDSWTSRAHEVLRTLSLQTRETTALAMLDEGDLRYVDEVNPPDRDHRSWLGTTVDPKHATSGGKVFLAFTDSEAATNGSLPRYTDTTITSRRALDRELAQVRSQGYALCRGEFWSESWGVSAPLLSSDQRLMGALSCWGPATRGEPERFAALGSLVRQAARGLVTQ